MLLTAAVLACAIWVYLLTARGGFWRADIRMPDEPPDPPSCPGVVAVVPARNEAAMIGKTLPALLAQDYPGKLSVILVDDHSGDGTADVAADAAAIGAADSLRVIGSEPLPPGWTGKLWALSQGVAEAAEPAEGSRYLWFTDADISHAAPVLRRLVALAKRNDLDLASQMVMLRCETLWERMLIPPFVFFFQKLYPFAWVNDPHRSMAAAAGGCLLLRRAALERAGGLAPIGGGLIDDCSLAAHIQSGGRAGGGRLWLGLTAVSASLRGYDGLGPIWRMVARSAYTQLGHSPWLLAATVVGMAAMYAAAPAIVLSWPWHGQGLAAAATMTAWALMAAAMAPTLRLYGQPLWRAFLLPIAAGLYVAMTIDSAGAHWCGRGGAWKGRLGLGGEPGHAR